MRYLAAYSGLDTMLLVFYSGLRLTQTVLYLEAYPGLSDMQSQGTKTIVHMKSYISMLDFTSVLAWSILYC